MRFILRVGVQTKRTQFIQTLQLTDLIIIIILLCVCVWVDAWMQDARQASAVPLVRYFFFSFCEISISTHQWVIDVMKWWWAWARQVCLLVQVPLVEKSNSYLVLFVY